jgi:hypothetical protein
MLAGFGVGACPSATEDFRVKVFKLAESNYASWRGVAEPKPGGYFELMNAFTDTLVSGRKPDNVIYEVALKEVGYGLNCRIEEVKPPMNADGRGRSSSQPTAHSVQSSRISVSPLRAGERARVKSSRR